VTIGSVFPPALAGLMIAALAAAYMSTVATQLNWGASYLVNDFYRRFLVKNRGEKHYVTAGQVATLALMLISSVATYYQDSISGAWKFLMAVGAGTGSVLILRWFWWRINAWSEVAAMAASFVASFVVFPLMLWLARMLGIYTVVQERRCHARIHTPAQAQNHTLPAHLRADFGDGLVNVIAHRPVFAAAADAVDEVGDDFLPARRVDDFGMKLQAEHFPRPVFNDSEP
jgi:hypothetical protein